MHPTAPSRRVTLVWAVLGFAATAWYFSWLLEPGRPGVAWLFAALIAADAFNGFHAVSFWLTCLRRPQRRARAHHDRPRVHALIPTLDEPLDVLRRTVRAARAMRGDVRLEVWLLDDGGRPEVEDLAVLEGARYVARPGSEGAKAGNLNHALRLVAAEGGDLVCVFDADHAPRPAFLERTLPLLGTRTALVQTPQVYANAAAGPLTRAAAEQQAIFFGPICSGRDGWGGTFCCGTNFVARLDALLGAGGFPEDSVTEDIVLSIRLAGQGWDLAYQPEPLADGLGPEDARSYLKQQFRWAAGCLDLLLRRPGTLRPLSWRRRWQYLVATSYWLTGWTVLVYLSLPVARLVFDAPVIQDPSGEFAVHFLPYFVLAVVSLGRFTHGSYTARGLVLNWGCFAVHVRATLAVLAGRPGGFAVTSKRALSGVPWRLLAPNLAALAVLAGASAFALARDVSPAVLGNVAFAVLGAALVGPVVAFAVVQAGRAPAPEDGEAFEPLPPRTGRFARDEEHDADREPVLAGGGRR